MYICTISFSSKQVTFYNKIHDDTKVDLDDLEQDDEEKDDYDDEAVDVENNQSLTESVVQIEGRAGKYQKSISIIERYAERPNVFSTVCKILHLSSKATKICCL